jgi:hypothetical protein
MLGKFVQTSVSGVGSRVAGLCWGLEGVRALGRCVQDWVLGLGSGVKFMVYGWVWFYVLGVRIGFTV